MEFTNYIKVREERFGAVVFDTLKEKVFVTNEAGKDILRLLEEGRSPDEIADILSSVYDADSAQIKGDVIGFIDQLKDNKIIG